jgi:hypothetical protein
LTEAARACADCEAGLGAIVVIGRRKREGRVLWRRDGESATARVRLSNTRHRLPNCDAQAAFSDAAADNGPPPHCPCNPHMSRRDRSIVSFYPGAPGWPDHPETDDERFANRLAVA